ncbi:hypothetical protein ACF3DV_05400 [Chlorogloeopsis fritschii PCC 9212]|uniref:hypothetical protein n=1 Tax=Chlorogloeopsis fritschii TaxID=1124 RepID=UPI000308B08C|nr:hypothetical protein [Chlorogloeopsis fritschii]
MGTDSQIKRRRSRCQSSFDLRFATHIFVDVQASSATADHFLQLMQADKFFYAGSRHKAFKLTSFSKVVANLLQEKL